MTKKQQSPVVIFDPDRSRSALERIKDRYFRGVIARQEGMVTHHGDCGIHRAKDVYGFACCTCGLIHDLIWLDDGLAEKIYSKYAKDRAAGEVCLHMESEPCDPAEASKLLEAVFGPPVEHSEADLEAIKRVEEDQWQLIGEVFGEPYIEYCKDTA